MATASPVSEDRRAASSSAIVGSALRPLTATAASPRIAPMNRRQIPASSNPPPANANRSGAAPAPA